MAVNEEVLEILKTLNFNQKEANAFVKSLHIVKKSFGNEDVNNVDDNKKEINIEEEFVEIIDEVFGNAIQKN